MTDSSAMPPPAPGHSPPPPGYGRSQAPAGNAPRIGSDGYPDENWQPEPGYFAQPTPAGGYPLPSGYGPPSNVPPPRAGVLGMRRNPFAVWLGLPIITLLVYPFVWVYKTNKELAAFDNRIKVDPMLSVLAFLIGWVIIVPPFVAAWRLGERVRIAQEAAGVPQAAPALSFVLWLVGCGPLFLQFQLNSVWDRYSGAVEGQQVPLFH